MFKRIRDFIYDINDVFVAIVILLIAVGVIFWRSTSIMAYPQYLAEKNGGTNTANLDFSDLDLEPDKVDPINANPDDTDLTDPDKQGGETNPGGETQPDNNQRGGETTPQPQGPDSQDGSVTAKITVAKGARWAQVARDMVSAGLMKDSDRSDFIMKVTEMKCDTKLQAGTFTLTNTSFEDMIKVLCRIKD